MLTAPEIIAANWHRQKFGERVDIAATYKKLLEEVGEVGEALIRNDGEHVMEELRDVVTVLAHLVRGATGRGLLDLLEEANEKLARRALQGGKDGAP